MFLVFIVIVNELLEKCNFFGIIFKFEECSDNFFVVVYRGFFGDDLFGKVRLWYFFFFRLFGLFISRIIYFYF